MTMMLCWFVLFLTLYPRAHGFIHSLVSGKLSRSRSIIGASEVATPPLAALYGQLPPNEVEDYPIGLGVFSNADWVRAWGTSSEVDYEVDAYSLLPTLRHPPERNH